MAGELLELPWHEAVLFGEELCQLLPCFALQEFALTCLEVPEGEVFQTNRFPSPISIKVRKSNKVLTLHTFGYIWRRRVDSSGCSDGCNKGWGARFSAGE